MQHAWTRLTAVCLDTMFGSVVQTSEALLRAMAFREAAAIEKGMAWVFCMCVAAAHQCPPRRPHRTPLSR